VIYRWPTFGTLTSRFGDSRPGGRRHQGIDIANAVGTPIFAAASGTVVFSGWSSGYGNLIILEHSNGDQTYYAHNSANRVRVGDVVASGQWIAEMGSTGRSTGSHLHFEIRKRYNGQLVAIDPLLDLSNSFTARN